MIEIEQWRGRIGSFNRAKSYCRVSERKDLPFTSTSIFLGVLQTMMSAMVIGTLLLIGGVESNPGPPNVVQHGMLSIQLRFNVLLCIVCIPLDNYIIQLIIYLI